MLPQREATKSAPAELRRLVPRIGLRGRPAPTGVFPLRSRRQTHRSLGLLRRPRAIRRRVVVAHVPHGAVVRLLEFGFRHVEADFVADTNVANCFFITAQSPKS